MVKIVELKTNRSLIKTNFDGYKLSLESVPVIKVDLEINQHPYVRKIPVDQYSFLHTELFSLQNFLVQDPWNREHSYFVGGDGSLIYCASYKESTGRPSPLKVVYKFSEQQTPELTRYNFSFKFISEKYCVLCDGFNMLQLFDTSDRYKVTEWKLLSSHKINENFEGFVLKDARLDVFDGKKVINCAFQHIEKCGSKNINQIHWGKLFEKPEQTENVWSWKLEDVLLGSDLIHYCAFEPKSASIVICSNKNITFQSNESKEKEENEKEDSKEKHVETKEDSNEINNNYEWSQSEDDVVISFKDVEYENKNNLKVICTDKTISVLHYDEYLLNKQNLCQQIDPELTTWAIENGSLQITLMKKDCTMWPYLMENDSKVTQDTAQNLEMDNKPTVNLETPLEDCDVAFNSDDEYYIYRINLELKEVTHQVPLGNNPPLFSTVLRPGFPAAIATRTDVDASLWLQHYNPLKPEEWALRHEGNLHAFGYVQASKQQKKYVDCAPDMGYSVISEPFRHVFIYKSKYETANNLRNRNGPQISLGKQSLITLDSNSEVLGMSCGINFITLLSEKCLLFIQLNKLNN
ncbi:nudC domain-containing protein 1 [Condylostylus longicornis]|uniref:nudC domain-containing protein 1 n=1 Tax=Condylostylus longicornis TaxID=2530218 RepID=UPI00244E2ACE|nr:nudC domain-containing protein 1 [Condylostylus longicornis]